MYVVSNAGAQGELSYQEFEAAMYRTTLACKVRVAIETLSPLELDGKSRQARIEAFGAQHVLTIRMSKGVMSDGRVIQASYDVSLWDAPQNKRVWRAGIALPLHLDPDENVGARFTRALMNQLVKDRVVVAGCYRNQPTAKQIRR